MSRWVKLLSCVAIFSLVSCSNIYYDTLERIGYQKRDLLKTRITATQTSQKETAQDFRTALQRFREIVPEKSRSFESYELERKYESLSEVVGRLEVRERDVETRIARVKNVAESLFNEWKDELQNYHEVRLREKSREKLMETKARYSSMMSALRTAHQRIQPALQPLQDQVLFLKHNLNASALSSVEAIRQEVAGEIASVIAEIERATAESQQFIRELG